MGSLQTMHNEDFYVQKKQKQLEYQKELDRQVNARKSVKLEPGSSMPSSLLQVELREVNQQIEEQQQPSNVGRYRKKYEIENHTNLLVNGSHVVGGVLQRDEAEILKRKKEQQRREMLEALQKQIDEKNAKKLENDRRELASATPIVPIRHVAKSPEVSPTPIKREPQPSEPVLLFNLEEAMKTEKTMESTDVFRKSQSVSLPREEENYEYLSQLCQKLIKEQEELKSKVTFQDSVIEKLQQSKGETPAPKRQQPPARRTSAQKLKQKQELERISEIEQKIDAARKRADERRNIKTRPEGRQINSRLERQTPRRVVSSTNGRVASQPLRMQSAVPKLTSEVELPPLLSAKSIEPVRSEVHKPAKFAEQIDLVRHDMHITSKFADQGELPLRHEAIRSSKLSDEFTGSSHFIYPNSEGHFDDELDKFMQSQVISRSPMLQSKFPRDVFTSKRGVGYTPS